MPYKLTYFDGRGRGEISRLLFAVSGTKFEDNRIDFSTWAELKLKTPLGSLPMLETEGKTLKQSLTIARYLASKFGYAGKSDLDKAIADGIVATVEDMRVDLVPVLRLEKDPVQKEKKVKEIMEVKLPPRMKFLEKRLIENGEYFVGKSLTWADLAVYDFMQTMLSASPSALDAYPKLKAHQDTVLKNKKISDYIKKRKESPL